MRRMALVRTTVASEREANALASRLVDAGLAACVHVQQVRSSYRWHGRRADEKEWLVEARTTWRLRRQATASMREGHAYELPLVERAAVAVDAAYARWAEQEMAAARHGT
jgi:periplasmic divalent cation tolerance protein